MERCVKVVAGLGNPGREYERTPHNVGFEVVASLSRGFAAEWRGSRRFQARIAKAAPGAMTVLLAQPQTLMNRSGDSVAPLLRYHGGTPEDLVVVLDDADLPLGRLRVRPGGGSGGHRGLASIIAALGTESFARVRLGIGRCAADDGLRDYVLRPWDSAGWQQAQTMIEAAADAVRCLLAEGVAEAMNRYNGWSAAAAPAQ